MSEYTSAQGQIPLALALKEKPGFELFVVGENIEALQSLKSIAKGAKHSCIYLWGQTGIGISHLLQATCILADETSLRIAYVPLNDQSHLDPQFLENLDSMDIVCIDDIDIIAGIAKWEQPLLHLYNRLRENGCAMIMGAHTSPQALKFELQDLKSRMSWDLVYHIKSLDDSDKIEMMQRRAQARGFKLSSEVADYIVKRVRRDMPSLIALLDDMEKATLAEKRKLTIPFVKNLLKSTRF